MKEIKEIIGQEVEEPDIDAPISNSTALQGPEQVQFETPNGYKISLGSVKFSVDSLCDLSMELLKQLMAITNHKEKGGNYLG